jgi:hypothetical protein
VDGAASRARPQASNSSLPVLKGSLNNRKQARRRLAADVVVGAVSNVKHHPSHPKIWCGPYRRSRRRR